MDDLSNTSNNLSGREEKFAIPEDQSGSEKKQHKKDANGMESDPRGRTK